MQGERTKGFEAHRKRTQEELTLNDTQIVWKPVLSEQERIEAGKRYRTLHDKMVKKKKENFEAMVLRKREEKEKNDTD